MSRVIVYDFKIGDQFDQEQTKNVSKRLLRDFTGGFEVKLTAANKDINLRMLLIMRKLLAEIQAKIQDGHTYIVAGDSHTLAELRRMGHPYRLRGIIQARTGNVMEELQRTVMAGRPMGTPSLRERPEAGALGHPFELIHIQASRNDRGHRSSAGISMFSNLRIEVTADDVHHIGMGITFGDFSSIMQWIWLTHGTSKMAARNLKGKIIRDHIPTLQRRMKKAMGEIYISAMKQ